MELAERNAALHPLAQNGPVVSVVSAEPRGAASLSLQNVSVVFGGLSAVQDVSFTLAPGALTGLIGPNGAGKTTIFNLATGVYRPTSGRITFAGRQIAGPALSARSGAAGEGSSVAVAAPPDPSVFEPPVSTGLPSSDPSSVEAPGVEPRRARERMMSLSRQEIARAGICRTFQNIRLFNGLTVLENVLVATNLRRQQSLAAAMLRTKQYYAAEQAARDAAQDLLRAMKLDSFAGMLARGLPYGAQRRLEIARALATQPRLLLLDEPAAGMNPQESADLVEMIRWVRGAFDITILLIEHDMKVVMGICERILVLENGALIADGKPEEIRMSERAPLLELKALNVHYGVIHAVEDLELVVRAGEIVTLIGANGAGKSTTLRTISGLIRPSSGQIRFEGRDIARKAPHDIVRAGIGHSPEGRRVFPALSVRENLQLGAYFRPRSRAVEEDLDRVFELFPRLKERRLQPAGTLSGGEQQMLAIGRAMMSRPRLLLLDEPSLGLAPFLVKEIFKIITEINRSGATVLLVEQNAHQALQIAHRGYVLETGRMILTDEAQRLLKNDQVRRAYLGE
ncbi:MAG: ATP-binding cassette domain-containing protein [Chloroflexi bacterium]|nr:ATP-binding cassette domain-containing protein [Chloroflexota bacterium]